MRIWRCSQHGRQVSNQAHFDTAVGGGEAFPEAAEALCPALSHCLSLIFLKRTHAGTMGRGALSAKPSSSSSASACSPLMAPRKMMIHPSSPQTFPISPVKGLAHLL